MGRMETHCSWVNRFHESSLGGPSEALAFVLMNQGWRYLAVQEEPVDPMGETTELEKNILVDQLVE